MWKFLVRLRTGKQSDDPESTLSGTGASSVHDTITSYVSKFQESDLGRDQDKIKERQSEYKSLVQDYYALVTDMYEHGWGESFHFAPRFDGETFDASLARHEHYLAARLGLKPGMLVLDAGCGIGGPMRAIARFARCDIVGVTISPYQVDRGNQLNRKNGLAMLCRSEFGNFMDLGENRKEMFHAAYAVEATCHAPDKAKCYREIWQTLKPGALFGAYEWAMTPLYDENNEEHRKIKHEIERGDALPDLPLTKFVDECLEKAGFEVLESFDVAVEAPKFGNSVPWYATLQGGLSLSQLKHSRFGRMVTQSVIDVLETVRVAPSGTSEAHNMLCRAADHLVRGGELGIFTPMYFVLARKPLE